MDRKSLFLAGGGIFLFGGGLLIGRLVGEATQLPPEGETLRGEPLSKSQTAVLLGSGDRSSGSGSSSRVAEGRDSDSSSSARSGSYGPPVGEILRDGDFGSRMQRLIAKLDRAGDDDFLLMFEEISNSGMAGVFHNEQKLIVSAWMKRDPYGAAEYLKENESSDGLQFAAMAAWAANDPAAAEQWARDNHEGERANDWLVGVIQGVAGNDPNKAAALISELPRSREQWRAMESTLPFVMEQGSAFARDWVANLGSGDLQSNGAQWMARRMANKDPQAAAAWVDGLTTKEARREASASVAQRYASQDLASAQSWVSSLPEDTRTEAAEGVVSVMAKDDIRGAVTWLEGLGDNPDYDGAWVDLVQSGFSSDPGVALVGALRLSDEGWREKYTGSYLAKWMKTDKAAAQSWVAEYTEYLPPKVTRRYVPRPPKAPKATRAQGS